MSLISWEEPLRRFLAKVKGRSSLSEEHRDTILRLPAIPRQVQAHRPAARVGHACLVVDGYVAGCALTEDGGRQIVSFHISGDMVDLHPLMRPAAPTSLIALSKASVLHIPHSALQDLVFTYTSIATAFWRESVVYGDIAAQWLVNVGRRNARSRLAHLLCELAVRSDQIGTLHAGCFPLPLTQEHLADALGLTPVHVNRTMQVLRSEKLIETERGEMSILNWNGLVAAGDFNAAYLHLAHQPGGQARNAV